MNPSSTIPANGMRKGTSETERTPIHVYKKHHLPLISEDYPRPHYAVRTDAFTYSPISVLLDQSPKVFEKI